MYEYQQLSQGEQQLLEQLEQAGRIAVFDLSQEQLSMLSKLRTENWVDVQLFQCDVDYRGHLPALYWFATGRRGAGTPG